MDFPSHIFKAYDIRGLANGEVSSDLAYRLGIAFVALLRRKYQINEGDSITVGRDMRPTSPGLEQALIDGIRDAGCDVCEIGMVSTPLFNFACAYDKNSAGGIMVTASHNPAEYNGFKMTLGGGQGNLTGLPIGKNNGINELARMVSDFHIQKAEKRGMLSRKNVLGDYIQYLFTLVKKENIKPLKIVIDCGNGMADATFPELLQNIHIDVTYLYREPDGRFPNHEANPLKVETLEALRRDVVARGADFGFALDGDADRIGLVDETGSVVDASYVGAIIGLEVLKKHPKAHMLYDLRSSNIVREVLEANGATTEMCMVGHALIKDMMKKTGAVFASELSLHLYYQDMFGVESSDLSLLYILELLSRENKPLSSLIAPLKKYFHSGEINFEVEDKDAAITRLEEKFAKDAVSQSRIDGLRLDFEDWWFSIRKSNTEPILRLNLEAHSESFMREKVDEIRGVING